MYKTLVNEVLKETLDHYGSVFFKPPPMGVRSIPKSVFMNSIKDNFIYKLLMDNGAFTNFDAECPTFIVVYYLDKHALNIPITGRYWIGVCWDLANQQLAKLTEDEAKDYLKYVIAHEITHVVESKIISSLPDLIFPIWESTKGIPKEQRKTVFSETLAEELAFKLVDKERIAFITDKLWGNIYNRLKVNVDGKN